MPSVSDRIQLVIDALQHIAMTASDRELLSGDLYEQAAELHRIAADLRQETASEHR